MGNLSKICSGEALKDFAPLWQSLCSRIPDCRIFQTFDWCWNAWECVLAPEAGNELYVLVWKQDGKDDIVIFPFYLDGTGSLRFIMDEHSDYCDCVYLPGRNHHLAFKDALEFIKADKRVKQIALHKMDADSEALNYFAALVPQASVCKDNTYSWISLAPGDSFLTTQSQLKSADKVRIRGIKRKADRFEMKIYSLAEGVGYPDEIITGLVEKMKSLSLRGGDFMREGMINFCRKLYEDGLSDIVVLYDSDGEAAIANYLLRMDGRLLSWVFLYSDSCAPTDLYVKYLCNKTITKQILFDFGSGGYEFKFRTFRPCTRALLGLNVILDQKLAMRFALRRTLRAAKDVLKLLLRKG